jgi:hypothetical protein
MNWGKVLSAVKIGLGVADDFVPGLGMISNGILIAEKLFDDVPDSGAQKKQYVLDLTLNAIKASEAISKTDWMKHEEELIEVLGMEIDAQVALAKLWTKIMDKGDDE